MSLWYCKQNDQHAGPYSTDEMRYLRSRGQLLEGDLIRRGTTGDWVAAGTVDVIFAVDLLPLSDFLRPKPIQPSQGVATSRRQTRQAPRAADSRVEPRVAVPTAAGDTATAVEQTEDDPTARRVLIGAAILVFLLLLLLLLLLLMPGGWGLGDGGSGGGVGKQVGQGEGSGSDGSGTDTGSGAATNEKSGSGNHDPSGASSPAGSTRDAAGEPPAGDARSQKPPPPDRISITPLDLPKSQKPPTKETGGASGDGDIFSGGSGGSTGGTEFFGVRARGNDIVYVVDCSSSMSGPPFTKACEELLTSIDQLKSRHKFYIYFFSHQSFPMFYPNHGQPSLMPATKENKQKVHQWVENFSPQGGTAPEASMIEALRLKPDVIFLLSDGVFLPGTVDAVRDENKGKVMINTIGFINRVSERLLKPIAEQNKGEYRFVP